jgi:hypothetical protein
MYAADPTLVFRPVLVRVVEFKVCLIVEREIVDGMAESFLEKTCFHTTPF